MIVSSVLAAASPERENHAVAVLDQSPGKSQKYRDFDLSDARQGHVRNPQALEHSHAQLLVLRGTSRHTEDLGFDSEVKAQSLLLHRVHVDKQGRRLAGFHDSPEHA